MDFSSALERTAALRAKVSAMERALQAEPHDVGLRLTLLSAKRQADRAEKELMDSASVSGVDVCRYRVVKQVGQYPAADLGRSLAAYQDLFTSVYDFVKNGAKKVARYTNEIKEQTALNIGYTYPGSVGVLLTIDNPRGLFFDTGEFDDVVNVINTLTELRSIQEVRQVAQKMGLPVVRSVYNWAEQNWQAQYSVDIKWARSDRVSTGRFVERAEFLKITSLIKQTEDEEPRDFEVVGTLAGYNVLTDSFSITSHNGDTFSGKLSDGFVRKQYKVPMQYVAQIREKAVTNYAIEKTVTTYELLSLDELAS